MFSRSMQRLRMLDEWADTVPTLDSRRPSYRTYLASPGFRRIAGHAHRLFQMSCWVCGRTGRELEEQNTRLTTAHISYPSEPFGEVIDPRNLTRSDVVLLCWPDHQVFDSIMEHRIVYSTEELREESVRMLRSMRADVRGPDDED